MKELDPEHLQIHRCKRITYSKPFHLIRCYDNSFHVMNRCLISLINCSQKMNHIRRGNKCISKSFLSWPTVGDKEFFSNIRLIVLYD